MINYPVIDLSIFIPYFFKGGETILTDDIYSKIEAGFIVLDSSIYELICRFEKEIGFKTISALVNDIKTTENVNIVTPCFETWTKATNYSKFNLSVPDQLFLSYADITNTVPITLKTNIIDLRKQQNKVF